MRKVDVLLINLPTGTWYRDKLAEANSMPPLGLLYIAATLKANGYKVKVLDFAVEEFSKDELAIYLAECESGIVGMSTYNESWNVQKMLCDYIKEYYPAITILAGGAFATFCYEDILKKSKTDYVIRGEGEYSFKEFCDSFFSETFDYGKIKSIKGIAFLEDNDTIFENGLPERIMNLDELPFPDRSLVNIEKYTLPFTISTSRGCPGDCIFCSSKAFWGKRVLMRSAENIFREVMKLHEEYNTNLFYITDDTFTASRKRCKEFCQLIKESGINFIWGCESRADIVDEELIQMINDAGCHKIQFGFESADNEILKKLKKHVTIEQIENAVRLAHKYNMHVQASYIIGHAFDTKQTIEHTIAFAGYMKDTYGARVVCSVNTPFPGTEQYEKQKELGINIYTEDWSQYVLSTPIISTRNVSINELRYYLGEGQKLVN